MRTRTWRGCPPAARAIDEHLCPSRQKPWSLEQIRRWPFCRRVGQRQQDIGAAIRPPGRHFERREAGDHLGLDRPHARVVRQSGPRFDHEICRRSSCRNRREEDTERAAIRCRLTRPAIVNVDDDARPRRQTIGDIVRQADEAMPRCPAAEPLSCAFETERCRTHDATIAGHELESSHLDSRSQAEIDHDPLCRVGRLRRNCDRLQRP